MRLAKPQAAKPFGFTLIEMLVVIAIILILAGMMVAVSPGVSTRQQAARGGTQVQGALLYSKQRAKMNMLPTGILVSSNGTSIQFVQAGGDFTSLGGATSPDGIHVQLNINPPPANRTINGGDYLEMAGSGLPHYIGVAIPNAGGYFLLLNSSLPTHFTQPVSYRVMRSPRQLFGEEPVQLPNDVAIDITHSAAFIGGSMQPCPPGVLFSPSGALTGPSTGYDIVCFMVRDTSLPYPQGFPTIIAVYGKTGFITAHPVNLPTSSVAPNNPFYFAQHARSSGM